MGLIAGNAPSFLTAAQVLCQLSEIESEGVEFYKGLRDGTESNWVRQLAEKMIRAELRHYKRFKEYALQAEEAAKGDATDSGRELPQEVRHLMETRVFAPRERIQKSAQYAGDVDVLKTAIHIEEATAVLQTQLREYVLEEQRPYISRVIKEEWKHKARLEDLLNKHFPQT